VALRDEFRKFGVAGQTSVNRGNEIRQGHLDMFRKHYLSDDAIYSVQWIRFELNRIDEHSQNRGCPQVKAHECPQRNSLSNPINYQDPMRTGAVGRPGPPI